MVTNSNAVMSHKVCTDSTRTACINNLGMGCIERLTSNGLSHPHLEAQE